ncbi:hypothetical protein DYB28_001540 [Aphanomyces astaci]|uniref:DNA-directed RNA polymerase subunit n=2 Tax=Aphanomyces astaci TaxID=112090 RepID=A0A9X8DTR5_APHAT|nr:hypothetical protein DYB28_001540 [Aphanomyces astaci]
MPTREPAPNGVLDKRLGVSNKSDDCETCHQKLTDCVGHFGYSTNASPPVIIMSSSSRRRYIQLELPVFHIGYIKATIEILQNICKSCSRVLLGGDVRESFLRRMKDPTADALKKINTRKRISLLCKKVVRCPHCDAINGTVRKIASPTLKIIHEKFRAKSAHDMRTVFVAQFAQAQAANSDLTNALLSKAQEDLSPVVVQELFERIPDQDCALLWLNAFAGRPEKLVMNAMLVPPVCIRPSVAMDVGSGSNEDDLTVKLQEIIQVTLTSPVNFALKAALQKGATLKMVMEDWDFLQIQVAQFMNGDTPGLTKLQGAPKPIRGLCQRLKVTRYNIAKLRQRVINGPAVHPGANSIRIEETYIFIDFGKYIGQKYTKNLMYGDRASLADDLKEGDVVERHMEDDDIVLFNRQPSLHKMSIMSHRAKVLQWRTFRFNECVCSPYNADFDGDEMNMHLPQTEEARAEAATLMCVPNNLITSRNGEPLVAATQDFLTASYLLTQKNIFFNREQFCQVLTLMGDGIDDIELPEAAIVCPIRLWTGKQVISLLVRPNRRCPVKVNFELKERNYTTNLSMCYKDGYVVFRNSELLSGNLCKKTLGDGSKKGLFYVLIRDHGSAEAARCMNRLAKLCARWLGNFKGKYIGDYIP